MCPVNTVGNIEFINYQAISKCLCELSKKCGGPEMFVDKRPQKKKFFYELARDSVIEETRLFQNFTTVVQKFKVLDLKFFFRNLLMNVKKRYPS